MSASDNNSVPRQSSAAPTPADAWADGAAYEAYIGRWSRLVAGEFLPWLGVAPNGDWLEVGCGTGVLSQAILDVAAPASLFALDRSAGFVAFAREHVRDARVRFELGDGHALPVEAARCDAVVSGLLLNFLAEPERALAEMLRAARPGATVAAYVWDYAGGMQFLRYFWDAAVALDPRAADLDEARRFPLCQPDVLADLFRGAGLREVAVRAIDVPTHFANFDAFWSPFLGGQGPAPSYLAALSAAQRDALRARLYETLPAAPDGSIALGARAWAVRGHVAPTASFATS